MSKNRAALANDRPRLIEGPPLRGHVVQHNDTHHLLIIDGVVVPCTPTEYALLLQLLEHVEEHVPFTHLLNGACAGFVNRQTRRTLTQYMSRVRAKLWAFGFDIFCITGYGYTLLMLPPESSEYEYQKLTV